MNALVKIHRKGQMTLPSRLRTAVGVAEGDLVEASYQVICASTACTIASSCQASANARMYFRLRGENPFMSGKARLRSAARRSITFAPQFSRCCRFQDVTADLPVEQDQLPIDGHRRAKLRRPNPPFRSARNCP